MRTNTPIWTTPEILEQTGFIMEIKEADATHDSGSDIDGVFATSSAGETPQEKMTAIRSTGVRYQNCAISSTAS